MSRQPDENGPAYLRTYRGLDGVVDRTAFTKAVEAQGLAAPSARMFAHIRKLYRDGQRHYLAMNEFDQMVSARRRLWTTARVLALVDEKAREHERLDFKLKLSDSTTKKAWAAMSNSGGGDVLYGVKEANSVAAEIVPVEFQGVEERITQLNQQIDPPTDLSVGFVPTDAQHADRGVVCVRVAASVRGVIHMVDHKVPLRDGTTTRYMNSEEIRRWVRERERPVQ